MVNFGCDPTEAEVAIREQLGFIKAHKDEIVAAMDMGPLLDAIGDAAIERAADQADALAALRDGRLDAPGRVEANAEADTVASTLDLSDPVLR